MTMLPDISKLDAASLADLPELRARLSAMLENGKEARLITTHSGDVLASNDAGAALVKPMKAAEEAARHGVAKWLMETGACDHDIKLQIGTKLTSYILHKVALEIKERPPLFLLIAREPNLSAPLIQALSQSRALYKDIVESIPGLVWETRADGCFSFVGGDHINGVDTDFLVDAPAGPALGIPNDLAQRVFLTPTPIQSIDVWINTHEAGRICLSVSAKPVLTKTGEWAGARGIALDVTADRLENDAVDAASQKLLTDAKTDGLTGLLNRRGFMERLEKICGQVRAADTGGYLALIDLDKFKQLNDTHGHQKGDEALIAVAQLLDRHIRREDMAGRLGGDEFVLWLENAGEDGVHRICQNMIQSMAMVCDDIALPGFGLGMSIGVTRLLPGRDTGQSLTERADQAMYAVKKNGRNAYKVATQEDGV